MEAIKAERNTNLGPSAGLTKRLRDFTSRCYSDVEDVIFDDKAISLLEDYAYDRKAVEDIRRYLNELKDPKGIPYSQSYKNSSELLESIQQYCQPSHPYFGWNENYQAAIATVKAEFSELRLSHLHYQSIDDVQAVIKKWDTHSGWSYIETGLRSKGEYLDTIIPYTEVAEALARKGGVFPFPILPGVRTTGSGAFHRDSGARTKTCKHKTRKVDMIDVRLIVSDGRFLGPVKEKMLTSSIFDWYAGGQSMDDIAIHVHHNQSQYQYWASLDYSRFDAGVNDWELRAAQECVRAAFVDEGFDEELWQAICNSYVHKEYVTPSGLVTSNRGMPSGMFGTNIYDSIINRLRLLTYFYSKGITKFDMLICGDDNLFFTNVEVDLDDLAGYMKRNFGAVISASKSDQGTKHESPWFLSRRFDMNGEWRHPNELLSKIMFPERRRNYSSTAGATPALVLFAYILEYRKAMHEVMDVPRFLRDYSFSGKQVRELAEANTGLLPGSLQWRLTDGQIRTHLAA